MGNFEQIKTIAIGAIGAGTSAGIENVVSITPIDISEGASLITQIVILIATLLGLFRKKKVVTN